MSVTVPLDTRAKAAVSRQYEDAAGSSVAVKTCPGVEDPPCGREIRANQTWCEDCSDKRRKLKRQGDNQGYYQANQEALKEKQRARYQQEQAEQDRKLVRNTVAWMKRERQKERDRSFWRSTADEERRRRMRPCPMPKGLRRVRRPRREKIMAEAQALLEQQNQRAAARARKKRNDPTEDAPPRGAQAARRPEVFTENARCTTCQPTKGPSGRPESHRSTAPPGSWSAPARADYADGVVTFRHGRAGAVPAAGTGGGGRHHGFRNRV